MQSRTITILLAVVATLSCQGDLGPIGPSGRTGDAGAAGATGTTMRSVLTGTYQPAGSATHYSATIMIPEAFGTTLDDMPLIVCYQPTSDSAVLEEATRCAVRQGPVQLEVTSAFDAQGTPGPFRVVIVR